MIGAADEKRLRSEPEIFIAWRAQANAEEELIDALQAAGLPDGWNNFWFDDYDGSIEFGRCADDYRLPENVLSKLWEMGFSRAWVNHEDGLLQTYYTPGEERRYTGTIKRGKVWHRDEHARLLDTVAELRRERDEAYERAANVCDALDREWNESACGACAKAIRMLKRALTKQQDATTERE